MAARFLNFDALVAELAEIRSRYFLAIAGAPGAGKSTLATALHKQLTARGQSSAVIQMDGFHFDDHVLVPRGLRQVKGAPQTFDVAGFKTLLDRLAKNEDAEIAVPVFDRELEVARAGAQIVTQDTNVLIIEGNYLLLDAPGWADLSFDMTIWLGVPIDELRSRLIQRWESAGCSDSEIKAKVDGNDMTNARLVFDHSRTPDVIMRPEAAWA